VIQEYTLLKFLGLSLFSYYMPESLASHSSSQLAHDGTMSLKREALAFEYPIESQRLGGGADQKVTNAEGERGRERER